MFGFIKEEKHEFLKKVLGVGALLGVFWETIEQLANGKPASAGVFGFCLLFIFLWLIDAFKEGASTVFAAIDTREKEAFSSKRTLPIDLPSPPTSESIEKLRSQLRELINQRFPPNRGSELNDYSYDPYVFRAEIRRSSLCACEVSVRVRAVKGNLVPSRVLTDEPQLYLGTLEVTIERTSGARKFVTVVLVLLVALTKAAGEGLAPIGWIWCIVSAIIYIMSWDRMSQWFPDTVLARLRTDIVPILVENGFVKPAQGTPVCQTGHPEPFWNVEKPRRRWKKVLFGTGILAAICALGWWWYTGHPPTLEDGLRAIQEGHYQTGKKILLQFAKGHDRRAQEQLEAAAEESNDYSTISDLADAGYAPAQFEIGLRWLLSGDKEGVSYLTKAADQGFADAQERLADCYLRGEEVPASRAEAKRLYLLAAAQGHHHAQFILHDLFLEQKDYKEAYYWVRICIEGPSYPTHIKWSDPCKREASRLGDALSKKDKTAIERRVVNFIATEGAPK